MGGSSCLAVTVAAALFRLKSEITGEPELSAHELIQLVQDIETKIDSLSNWLPRLLGGLSGGINFLTFQPGKMEIRSPKHTGAQALNERLLVCYSGKSRASGINNWEIFKQVFNGDLS